MRDALPHLFEAAPSLMYQLVTMLSPTQLKARGVPVCRLVHQEGSFVITFPNAYHAGFNTGGPRPHSVLACPPGAVQVEAAAWQARTWVASAAAAACRHERLGRRVAGGLEALLLYFSRKIC